SVDIGYYAQCYVVVRPKFRSTLQQDGGFVKTTRVPAGHSVEEVPLKKPGIQLDSALERSNGLGGMTRPIERKPLHAWASARFVASSSALALFARIAS